MKFKLCILLLVLIVILSSGYGIFSYFRFKQIPPQPNSWNNVTLGMTADQIDEIFTESDLDRNARDLKGMDFIYSEVENGFLRLEIIYDRNNKASMVIGRYVNESNGLFSHVYFTKGL